LCRNNVGIIDGLNVGTNMYRPPFTISSKAINLIAQISAQLERYAIKLEQVDSLRLRKVNRIKTIYSSLAIEGNTLSEGEVLAIIDGKRVIAPQKEIQEVKNAIKTYELYPTLNPYSVKDLLKAHHTLMAGLVDEAGVFRKKGVGVFEGEKAIHIAPPANRIEDLISDLFNWLEHSEDHLLIRSCVFHYEFEFIHPFMDGNGRMGRFWQSLILGKLNPIFEYLPVENMVFANQQAYYDAIEQSSILGDSQPFIDFMLQEILNTLEDNKEMAINEIGAKYNLSDNSLKIVSLIRADKYVTAKNIAEKIGISSRQVERVVANLKKQGIIERIGAKKNGYWEIIK
jgi:Fic family protein